MLIYSLLLALAAVGFGQLAELMWRPLAVWTYWIVERLLGLCYSTVIVDPNDLVVGTRTFSIQIAPECSGYEGIGLIAVYLGAFLWWFRDQLRFPRSLSLVLLGAVAIWIANAVRIAALIAVGTSLSKPVALGGFHSQAGWLAFNLIALGTIAVAWNSPFFAKRSVRAATGASCAEYPAAPFLTPFLTWIATAMICGALATSGFNRFYPLQVFATLLVLAFFFGTYRRREILAWSWSWDAVAIGGVVFCIWMALEPMAKVDVASRSACASALVSMPTWLAAFWLLMRCVGSIVVVPVMEELAFRGYLTRRLIADDFETVPMGEFSWFSLIISSLVFGLMHQRWIAGVLAGLLFAAAFYRRGRLMDAIVAHATANGLVTGYVLMTRDWTAWS